MGHSLWCLLCELYDIQLLDQYSFRTPRSERKRAQSDTFIEIDIPKRSIRDSVEYIRPCSEICEANNEREGCSCRIIVLSLAFGITLIILLYCIILYTTQCLHTNQCTFILV